MGKELFIGADIGTSNVKAVIFDETANQLGESTRAYPTFFPKQNCAEQDPQDWWRNFTAAVKDLKSICSGRHVAAVSISSHVPSLTPVDRNGNAFMRSLIWMDNRSLPQCSRLEKHFKKLLQENTPAELLPYHFLPKLLWFRENCPEAYGRTWKFLQPKDYVNYKLTGRGMTDVSCAGLNHLFHVYDRKYSKEAAKELKIDLEKMPEVCRSADIIGTVLPEPARELGLSEDTAVLCGGVDTAMAALGSGILKKGDIIISAGTGGNIVFCTDKLAENPHLAVLPYVVDGLYLQTAVQVNIGGVLKWFENCFGEEYAGIAKRKQRDPYDVITQCAATRPAGAGGLMMLPFLNGELAPVYDPHTKGVFWGISPNTQRDDFARAVLEGVCLSIRQSMDMVEEGRSTADCIMVAGGIAQSAKWMQIMADVLQKPVVTGPGTAEAPVGNALLGIRKFGFCQEYLDVLPNLSAEYIPDPRNRSIYEKLSERFRKLYSMSKELFRESFRDGRA
ncbi:xylulokinase [Christensenella tenuis]|jgi:xylulokinase|uniref:Xylulokinase n=1 Tax=Christensenella tenuis TaxID=2763033 RepID=A0ABR7EHN8_9FIRM|nr:FGGY family carbohydrate kinase [Christensenella tenuis]MBC5648658.1 hypothetical protein [Christensenella tenuis]